MPVFDGATKVNRAVLDPGDDKTLPPPGALSYGAVTSPSALAGTTGSDALLVHGNTWRQISGNEMVNIGGNDTINITGNETVNVFQNSRRTIHQNEFHTVMLNRTMKVIENYNKTIVGICNETIINVHNFVNLNVRNNTYVNQKIEIHNAPKQSQEPTGWWQYIKDNTKLYYYKTDIVMGPRIVVTLADISIGLVKAEAYAFKGSAFGFQVQLICLRMDVRLSDNRIEALCLKLTALNGHMGPLDMQAVALKVMGLALGVNQYI